MNRTSITRRSLVAGLLSLPAAARAQIAYTGEAPAADDINILQEAPPISLDKPLVWTGFGSPVSNGGAIQPKPEPIQNFTPRAGGKFAGIRPKDLLELTRTSPLTRANLPTLRGIWLQNPHTREEVLDVFWSDSAYNQVAYGRFCHLMRDWRENVTSAMDPRLFHLLWAVQHRIGFERPIIVTSGFRTVQTNAGIENAAIHSYHLRSQASDIKVPGVPASQISDFVHALGLGGVGFYGDRFTHVDSGPKRSWVG